MIDTYTKTVLTVIAGALLYLCVAMTEFPAAHAQTSRRPGESTGPGEVIVVGWRPTTPMPIVAVEPLRVITEQGAQSDRVVVVGWERGGDRAGVGQMVALTDKTPGIPVKLQP